MSVDARVHYGPRLSAFRECGAWGCSGCKSYLYLRQDMHIHLILRRVQNNVLVNGSGRAILADFGLVNVLEDIGSRLITYTRESGSKTYLAPELHDPEDPEIGLSDFQRTPASDAYAYGSLILEVRLC
jgi:hypothetical protein